jgi:hypothetical protein
MPDQPARPHVDLTDVLLEVDQWGGFGRHLVPTGGGPLRTDDFLPHLYAVLMAQGSNIGLIQVAHSVNLTRARLAWGSTCHLREETLKAAVAALVNFQYRPPLAEHWGGRTLSSSDGRRFPVRGRVGNARALPRHFGCGQGITFYTWGSDQFAQRCPWAATGGHAPCATSGTAPNHPMRAWALT